MAVAHHGSNVAYSFRQLQLPTGRLCSRPRYGLLPPLFADGLYLTTKDDYFLLGTQDPHGLRNHYVCTSGFVASSGAEGPGIASRDGLSSIQFLDSAYKDRSLLLLLSRILHHTPEIRVI